MMPKLQTREVFTFDELPEETRRAIVGEVWPDFDDYAAEADYVGRLFGFPAKWWSPGDTSSDCNVAPDDGCMVYLASLPPVARETAEALGRDGVMHRSALPVAESDAARELREGRAEAFRFFREIDGKLTWKVRGRYGNRSMVDGEWIPEVPWQWDAWSEDNAPGDWPEWISDLLPQYDPVADREALRAVSPVWDAAWTAAELWNNAVRGTWSDLCDYMLTDEWREGEIEFRFDGVLFTADGRRA